MMIQLSHIGEVLIAELLKRSQAVRTMVLGDQANSNWTFEPEIRLNGCGSLIFDGAHKIDISALNKTTSRCIAVEAKLGLDRLSKNEFNKRFLSPCGTSHKSTRVSGSMISVLERLLPEQIEGEALSVQYDNNAYQVNQSWVLIVRRQVVKGWKKNGRPDLSENCQVVVLEDIVEAYGNKQAFNDLIFRILDTDYYSEWFTDTKSNN